MNIALTALFFVSGWWLARTQTPPVAALLLILLFASVVGVAVFIYT